MMKAELATEITIGLENKPGELAKVLSTLARAQVNIRAFTAYVEGAFGFVKLVPNDCTAASQALDSGGYNAAGKQVALVEAPERLGAGAELFSLLAEAGINVTHSHATVSGPGTVLVVIASSDNAKVVDLLTS